MSIRQDRRLAVAPGGFTLLELVIVVCIVSALVIVLLDRLRVYQRMAEKTAVEQMVGTLQSALNLRFASLITQDRLKDASILAEQNPITWLVKKPANYAGEFFGTPDDVKAGQWYFDLKDRELVYFVSNSGEVEREKKETPHLRFKTELVKGNEDFPGKGGSIAGKIVEGIVVTQIVPYGWE